MSQNSNKKKHRDGGLTLLIAAAVGIVLLMSACRPAAPVSKPPQTTALADQTLTAPSVQMEIRQFQSINLGYGLSITDVGSYTGMYMEDGSDEIVSGVMMIVVSNEGDEDIQLADIELSQNGEIYSFRLTNLAAGARAVVLERERREHPEGEPQSAILKETVIFSEPVGLCEDRIGISGMDGMLNIQNVSDTDIDGDVYVYYKYAADDLFYGGITFRVRVEGGLDAGEIRQIPAGHYSPSGCAIIHVECHG